MNGQLFRRLADEVPADMVHHIVDRSTARWISTSEHEKAVLKHGRVGQSIDCLPGRRLWTIVHDPVVFVVLPHETDQTGANIQGVQRRNDSHAGVLTLLWAGGNIPPNAGCGVEVLEFIFSRTGAFSVDDLRPYFAPSTIWELERPPDRARQDAEVSAAALRLYAALLLLDGRTALTFTPELSAAVLRLLNGPCGRIAASTLFRAVTAQHWPHVFLDVYRCLERLFPFPYLERLATRIGHRDVTSLENYAADLLGWRPKESEALIELFRLISGDGVFGELAAALDIRSEDGSDHCAMVARCLYARRNSVAHFRIDTSEPTTGADWPRFLVSLCRVLDVLYARLGSHF